MKNDTMNDVQMVDAPTTNVKSRIRKIKAAAAKIREMKGEKEPSRTIAGKSQKEIKAEVRDLLDELRTAKTTDDKKRIRRALRARGHTGGLGGRKGYIVEKTIAKKGRRAKRQAVGNTSPAIDVMNGDDAVAA